jgi:hypothetical protein
MQAGYGPARSCDRLGVKCGRTVKRESWFELRNGRAVTGGDLSELDIALQEIEGAAAAMIAVLTGVTRASKNLFPVSTRCVGAGEIPAKLDSRQRVASLLRAELWASRTE